ncbi:MAG: FtsH protease activity modulator HflK [Chloroflexi bacterium]|nr:MAG: FtsH protease activity modulator HflK [Chloroflexota bacterium]
MAWNEPGGGDKDKDKDKDPWGSRGDQGPPDLDEAFKKLQAQLAGIFGGGRGGSGTGSGFSLNLFGLILLAVAVIYGALGVYQLDAQERGVIFRFGAVLPDVELSGLHWNAPIIDVVEKVNVTRVNSVSHQALMLTEDENIVDVSLTVQWVVGDPVAFLVNVRNPQTSLDHATESALRHEVGSSTMDEVITEGRAALAIQVEERLQIYLDRYQTGIVVTGVQIDQSGPPRQVQDAFDDVQKAKEDEVRLVNEANAYAESVIPEARGEAQRQLEEASAYRDQVIARADGEAQRFTKLLVEYKLAKRVTRDRLYIDAMEKVLANSSKVMIDVEGGNNLLYLPLDRLMQQSARSGSSLNQDSLRDLADAIARENSDRTLSGRQPR